MGMEAKEKRWSFRRIFKVSTLVVILAVSAWALWPESEQKAQTRNGKDGSTRKEDIRFELRMAPGFYMPGVTPSGVGEPMVGMQKVIDRFEELFPDTRVEPVVVPMNREYIVTQLSSGMAPDILSYNVEDVWADVHKGWYIPLDQWLEKPNPFIPEGEPGSEAWWDILRYQAISRGKAAPDGLMYCLSYDMVETAIYYNKDIFREMGVAVPQSWEEFEAIMEKAREAGYTPIALTLAIFYDWCVDLFLDQLYADILPGIDLEQDPKREQYLEGYLDWYEICFLHEKGFFTAKDPRFRAIWDRMDRLRDFSPKDIATVDINRLFMNGKSPMLWSGSWTSYRLDVDPDMDFDWGVFYLPPILPENSPYVTRKTPMCVIGGVATQFEITNSAVSDTDPSLPMEERIAQSERLKRVVAFLQFLTVPQNAETIINERPILVPNIKGVPVLPLLKPIEKILERRYTTTKWTYSFDLKYVEILSRMLGLYLEDAITQEELLEWFEGNLSNACTVFNRRKKPDWQSLQDAWEQLAPLRAKMKHLPEDLKE